MLRPAVFLDRDQTLIQPHAPEEGLEDLQLEQGAAAAVASIRGLGYKVVIVTNEDAVAQGKLTEGQVNAKHHRIRELIETKTTGAHVDAFYFCPFKPKSRVKAYSKAHADRIPKPGLWQKAAEELGIDLTKSWTIAHAKECCKAGKSAETRTIHLDPAIAGKAHPDQPGGDLDYAVGSLIEAVRVIAQQRKPETAEEQRQSPKRWDKARIAELQKPRSDDTGPKTYQPSAQKPFRPLDAPTESAEESPAPTKPPTKPATTSTAGPAAKPATAQQTSVDEPPTESVPAASKKAAKRVRRVKKAARSTAVTPAAESTTEPATQAATAGSSPVEPRTTPEPVSAETVAESKPEPVIEAVAETASAEARPAQMVVSNQETERLLRQLLQEVRQRGKGGDLGSLDMLAIGTQAMAVVCLLGGLLMNDQVFVRWIGTAVMAQLVTIALLLFSRR